MKIVKHALYIFVAVPLLLALSLYATSNQPPVADFTFSPLEPSINEPVAFDASASQDPDGTIIKYEWDFNDDGIFEESSDSPTAEHTYSSGGVKQVSLWVTDDDGAYDVVTKEIEVKEKSIVSVKRTISTPMKPNKVSPGDIFKATVEIHINEDIKSVGLDENLPEGWRVQDADRGSAELFKKSELQWFWFDEEGLLAGEIKKVVYEVRVPGDAESGTYKIEGSVTSFSSPRFKIQITEDSEVQVI